MSEPLQHDVNINAKLASYGITDHAEPMMRVLGGRAVTAETNARRALTSLASLLAGIESDPDALDSFDPDHLEESARAVAAYHRARRQLLATAQGLSARS